MAMLWKVSSSLFLHSLSNLNSSTHQCLSTFLFNLHHLKAQDAERKSRVGQRKLQNTLRHQVLAHSVMLGEVMDVFSAASLTSFVDCTLGVVGHSIAVIKGHPEMKFFVGMHVDFVAHDIAQPRLDVVLSGDVKAFTVLRNFRDVKSVLREFSDLHMGVDGNLLDLGMSSIQAEAKFGYLLE